MLRSKNAVVCGEDAVFTGRSVDVTGRSFPARCLDDPQHERRMRHSWTLEVVAVSVSDLDRAKAFYAGKLGFEVDHDAKISDEYRVAQPTP